MYWRQGGGNNLPFLVRTCLESWRIHNPAWEVRLLGHDELTRLVDLDGFDRRADIALQALSDIVRVKLLQRYGGVWVDASLFCVKPLDDWLPEVMQDGFFVFSSRRKDRVMTTWFIAAQAQCELLSRWTNEICRYWHSNRFRRQGYWSRQILRKLMSLRKREMVSNNIWFSTWLMKGLRLYPYPVNMYLFERMLDHAPALRQRWFERKMLYDQPAEYLQNVLGMNAPGTKESFAYLSEYHTPVHKLNWRQDLGYAEQGSNFDYLIQGFNAVSRVPRKGVLPK